MRLKLNSIGVFYIIMVSVVVSSDTNIIKDTHILLRSLTVGCDNAYVDPFVYYMNIFKISSLDDYKYLYIESVNNGISRLQELNILTCKFKDYLRDNSTSAYYKETIEVYVITITYLIKGLNHHNCICYISRCFTFSYIEWINCVGARTANLNISLTSPGISYDYRNDTIDIDEFVNNIIRCNNIELYNIARLVDVTISSSVRSMIRINKYNRYMNETGRVGEYNETNVKWAPVDHLISVIEEVLIDAVLIYRMGRALNITITNEHWVNEMMCDAVTLYGVNVDCFYYIFNKWYNIGTDLIECIKHSVNISTYKSDEEKNDYRLFRPLTG